MKKPHTVLYCIVRLSLCAALISCAGQNVNAQTAQPTQGNILIAYFSLYGNDKNTKVDAATSASIVAQGNKRVGTTELIADMIQSTVGGDKWSIQVVEPYPAHFDNVVTQARQERSSGFRPSLKNRIENIAQYDTVFIGYPVWGTTIPGPVETFLSGYDLREKTIIPFCTHDGYGSGRSYSAVSGYCPQSKILPGVAIEAAEVIAASERIQTWLKSLNIAAGANDETPILITIGNRRLSGVLNNSPEAKAFLAMLPQTITMVRYGDREYYGGVSGSISVQSKGKYTFFDGEITYCPANNTAAIFFAQTSRPSLGMEVFSMGKVTSDLSAFKTMENRVQIRFERGGR